MFFGNGGSLTSVIPQRSGSFFSRDIRILPLESLLVRYIFIGITLVKYERKKIIEFSSRLLCLVCLAVAMILRNALWCVSVGPFFVAFSFLCHFFILVFGNYWVGWMPPIYRVHLFHFSVVSTCHFLSGCNYGIVVCLPLPTSSREHIGIFSYFPLHCWATTTCQHKNKGGWCRIVDKDSTLT